MKKYIVLFITVILLWASVKGEDQKVYELTDTDIMSQDLKITSKNLTVRGIGVDMPILEVLTKPYFSLQVQLY